MESPPCSKTNALSSQTFGIAFIAVHTRNRLSRNNDNGMANVCGPISSVASAIFVVAILFKIFNWMMAYSLECVSNELVLYVVSFLWF